MLPQHHRLRDRAVFRQIYRQGKRSRGQWLTLICLPHSSTNDRSVFSAPDSALDGNVSPSSMLPSRWAIVVSKKVSRRAVERNRIRRRLRSCVYRVLPHIQSGWDVLLIAQPTPPELERSPLLDVSDMALWTEISTLLRRVDLSTVASELS